MNCSEAVETAVRRLAGDVASDGDEGIALDAHLTECSTCRNSAEESARTWSLLGEDEPLVPRAGFRRETLQLLEVESLRRRLAVLEDYRPSRQQQRRLPVWLSAAAAATIVAGLAGFGGWSLAQRRVDSMPMAALDAAGQGDARLANVVYTQPAGDGRIGVAFDMTSRYNVAGNPEDERMAELLARLVGGSDVNSGTRGRAIDLVAEHYTQQSPVSDRIVEALSATLRKDRNPGVRAKAAEALAQMPASVPVRDAFIAALEDENPKVRITAVESLARIAPALKDAATIRTLRETASDAKESGYVREKAANALANVDL